MGRVLTIMLGIVAGLSALGAVSTGATATLASVALMLIFFMLASAIPVPRSRGKRGNGRTDHMA